MLAINGKINRKKESTSQDSVYEHILEYIIAMIWVQIVSGCTYIVFMIQLKGKHQR